MPPTKKIIKKEKKKPNKELIEVPEPKEDVYKLKEYIYEINFEKEFESVKEWLQYKPTTPLQIEESLYSVSEISNKTQLLIEHIKLEEKRYELKSNERLEILRSNAIEALEEEKKEKNYKKQITNQMIEDRILAEYPSVYIGIKEKQNELKAIRHLIENVMEQVKNREVNLRKILDCQILHRGRFSWANKKNGD